MQKKNLFEQNPHLKDKRKYQEALRTSVLSSTAIEGVRKAAERGLAQAIGKRQDKAR